MAVIAIQICLTSPSGYVAEDAADTSPRWVRFSPATSSTERRRGAKDASKEVASSANVAVQAFASTSTNPRGNDSRPDRGKSGAGDQNGRPSRHPAPPCTTRASPSSTPPPEAVRRPRDHRRRALHVAVPPSRAPPRWVGATPDAPLAHVAMGATTAAPLRPPKPWTPP
jgi:hypothetical protein